MKTFKEAAEQLGVSYTTIDRRVGLLGLETGLVDGVRAVDVDELVERWSARRGEVRPQKRDEAFLSVTIRPDQRAALEEIQKRWGGASMALVVRWVLDEVLGTGAMPPKVELDPPVSPPSS